MSQQQKTLLSLIHAILDCIPLLLNLLLKSPPPTIKSVNIFVLLALLDLFF